MPPHDGESDPQPMLSNEKPAAFTSTTPIQWDKLETMILDYYENVKLMKDEYLEAVAFTQNLQEEIRKTMPGARLEIGGSLCNGFGTHDSDVDLCFRLEEDNKPKGFDELKTLSDLSEILTGMGLNNRIIRAKVKIIKCNDKNSMKRSIDISCYNSLPLYNTKLLAKYCEWEPKRLPALGVWVKKWAKGCAIGDASEGTLSSYAWMIILIHYLQNCSPPVLPRLQEDFRTAEVAVPHMNCDVYFYETVHKNWSSNKQSVSELFSGFLAHLRSFDYHNLVMQIRRKEELTKGEKKWRGQMCVEDPFLLTHNMAQRRGKNVITYIWNTVENSQKAFLMTEEFDAEEVLESCRLRMDRQTLRRCALCDSRGLCKAECENRYIRHPNWISKEERAKRRRLRKEQKELAKQNDPEYIEKRNRRQANQITGQFSNLMIAQQNLAPHLQYPIPFPLMSPPPHGYPVPTHLPPPPVGMPMGGFTHPPLSFPPLITNGRVPQQKKSSFKPSATKEIRGQKPQKGQRPFTGIWTFYNSSHQPIPQQAPPDFNNEDDFPAL